MQTGNQKVVQLAAVNSATRAKRKDAKLNSHFKISESQLRLQICKMMLYRNWQGGKCNTQGTFLTRRKSYIMDRYLLRGMPDLIFFKGDIMLGIEIKIGKNKQSEHQKKFEAMFHRPELKRYYLLVRSWEAVEEFLKGLK